MKKDKENNENSNELDKETRIKKEKGKLGRLFTKMDTKLKKAVQSLINEAAFMAITLEDLREAIDEKGVTEEYHNGANQFGVKKSAEVEVYNTMIKNFANVMKQLTDLLKPRSEGAGKGDGFEEFVNNR